MRRKCGFQSIYGAFSEKSHIFWSKNHPCMNMYDENIGPSITLSRKTVMIYEFLLWLNFRILVWSYINLFL